MVSLNKYVADAFRMYAREHGIDLQEMAMGCIRSGDTYDDCEERFQSELRDVAMDFQRVIGQYMADDVVIAVSEEIEFEDLVDTDDLFDDEWVAYNRKPTQRRSTSSQCVRRKSTSGGGSKRKSSKAPAKQKQGSSNRRKTTSAGSRPRQSSSNRKKAPAKRNPAASRRY